MKNQSSMKKHLLRIALAALAERLRSYNLDPISFTHSLCLLISGFSSPLPKPFPFFVVYGEEKIRNELSSLIQSLIVKPGYFVHLYMNWYGDKDVLTLHPSNYDLEDADNYLENQSSIKSLRIHTSIPPNRHVDSESIIEENKREIMLGMGMLTMAFQNEGMPAQQPNTLQGFDQFDSRIRQCVLWLAKELRGSHLDYWLADPFIDSI